MKEIWDVTGLSPEQAQARLEEAFAGLPVGESAELAWDQDPVALLPAFQEEHWGEFDWAPLERGPEQWRSAIHRGREQPGRRALREFMSYDHRRCDTLYAQMENAAGAGDMARAKPLYEAFELGMLHHFTMEDEGFFPEFEERTGMRQGPTMVMRMEHEQMRGIMRQMRQALEAGDLNALVRGGGTLLLVMQQHNVKEEQMLYTMADMRLGDAVDPLLKKMQGM